MDTPNLNQITDTTTRQRADTQGFLTGQKGEQGDYLTRFTNAVKAQPTMSAMASRIGGELGLPQLQGNATMLRNTLTNLPSTYSGATRGFDVNANQLNRIIGQKSSELAPAVDTAERSLSDAQNTLSTRLGYEQADQQKELLPYQTEQSLLSERQARESTMFSQENQSELDGLIAKINAGITLSEGEKNRANQLAVAEQSFEHQKQLNEQQAKLNPPQQQNADTSIIEVSGHKKLIDNKTGRVIQDLGASNSGTGTTPNPLSYLTGGSNTAKPSPSPNFRPLYGPGY